MSHLKRKSVDGSLDAEPKANGDAPSKRIRVDEAPDAGTLIEETDNQNTHIAHKSGGGRDTAPVAQEVSLDDSGATDGAHRSNEAEAAGLPDSERAGLEKRTLGDSHDHSLSPSKDRRQYDSGRRSPPPPVIRSPETNSRTYESRWRNPSPPPQPRHRRESEVSKKRSDVIVGDRDRQRRESLNKEEEKKRGKRLFGGLLSTLSQSTTNSQQRKRQEIEKRQQEKATKQRSEDDKRRSGKLKELDRIRKIEQVRFDEQVVCLVFRGLEGLTLYYSATLQG